MKLKIIALSERSQRGTWYIVYDSIYINSEKFKFISTVSKQTSGYLGMGRWRVGGCDYEEAGEALGVMEMLILVVVMVSWVWFMCRSHQTVHFNICSLLDADYSSINLFFKRNNRRKQLLGKICPQFHHFHLRCLSRKGLSRLCFPFLNHYRALIFV